MHTSNTWATGSAGGIFGVPPEAGSPGAAGTGPGGEAARLEVKADNRTCGITESRMVFRDVRCNSRTCPRCGPRYGVAVREGLLARRELFTKPAMLTLTVARGGFSDPEAAHEGISKDGLIRRLMRFLEVSAWFWVLEFQMKTGEGWPHWHLLIDLANVPSRRLDLGRAWHLWRDKWGVGGLDLQIRKKGFATPTHAIFYITKYLVKPAADYPVWLLVRERRLRFCQGSKAIGAILGKSRPVTEPHAQAAQSGEDSEQGNGETSKPHTSLMRPMVERLAACGTSSIAMVESRFPGEDRPMYRYLGTLPASGSRLLVLKRLGGLPAEIQADHHEIEWDGGSSRWVTAYMPPDKRRTFDEQFEKLESLLRTRSEEDHRLDLIDQRQKEIMAGGAEGDGLEGEGDEQ